MKITTGSSFFIPQCAFAHHTYCTCIILVAFSKVIDGSAALNILRTCIYSHHPVTVGEGTRDVEDEGGRGGHGKRKRTITDFTIFKGDVRGRGKGKGSKQRKILL